MELFASVRRVKRPVRNEKDSWRRQCWLEYKTNNVRAGEQGDCELCTKRRRTYIHGVSGHNASLGLPASLTKTKGTISVKASLPWSGVEGVTSTITMTTRQTQVTVGAMPPPPWSTVKPCPPVKEGPLWRNPLLKDSHFLWRKPPVDGNPSVKEPPSLMEAPSPFHLSAYILSFM